MFSYFWVLDRRLVIYTSNTRQRHIHDSWFFFPEGKKMKERSDMCQTPDFKDITKSADVWTDENLEQCNSQIFVNNTGQKVLWFWIKRNCVMYYKLINTSVSIFYVVILTSFLQNTRSSVSLFYIIQLNSRKAFALAVCNDPRSLFLKLNSSRFFTRKKIDFQKHEIFIPINYNIIY